MNKITLLDTGPWVACIDSGDNKHKACLAWIMKNKGKFVSTLAVMTETLYLLNDSIKSQQACFNWVRSGVVTIADFDGEMLEKAENLMVKYGDIPMDFADATMVVLAEKLCVGRIFTLDHRGFATFKYDVRKKFEIVP
jgi:predicted nucleic acid-binding protein